MTANKSICLGCKQKYTGWATSTICPDCGDVLEPITDTSQADELPITCEFPIENLPYEIKAHKIGNDTMLTFMGKDKTKNKWGTGDYFAIAIRDKSIHIGTYGG